jgi:leukotriene-A4 hydrolase
MEHPMLAIVSPEIMTKDKSSLEVIIHEIAHSWTGNTVTCANWRHLWLNEGLTTYI